MFCLFMYYSFLISFVFVFSLRWVGALVRYYRPQAAVLKSFLPICERCLFIVRRFKRGVRGTSNKARYKVMVKFVNIQAVNLLYFNYFCRIFAPVLERGSVGLSVFA